MPLHVRKRLFKQRKFRQLLIALAFLSLFLGVVIVPIEASNPEASITSPFKGIYWAVTTLTTVGYGDIVPVTMVGQTIAIMLQLVGAMMFGLVIAMISSFVNRSQDEFYMNRLFERVNQIEDLLVDLKKSSDFVVKHNHNQEEDHEHG